MRRTVALVASGLMLGTGMLSGGVAVADDATRETGVGKARGATTVTLDEGTLAALAPLNPTAKRPATLKSTDSATLAVFPVVGNAKAGTVKHVGGLRLATDDARVVVKRFVIDTNAGVLTAKAAIKKKTQRPAAVRIEPKRVELFDVVGLARGDGNPCDATADLTLASQGSRLLNAAFDTGNLTGAPIGAACVALR